MPAGKLIIKTIKRCPNHPKRKVKTRGLCGSCYDRWLKEHNPEYAAKQRKNVRDWVKRNVERSASLKKQWRQKKGWHYQRTKILRAYGLTLDDYDKLLALQGGVCAICLCPPKPGKAFNVDHCHETGAVRGLLCFRCNFGISFFREDETVFKRVLEHLKRRYVPEQ